MRSKMHYLSHLQQMTARRTFSIISHVNELPISVNFHKNRTLCAIGRVFLRENSSSSFSNMQDMQFCSRVTAPSTPPLTLGCSNSLNRLINIDRVICYLHICLDLCLQHLRPVGIVVWIVSERNRGGDRWCWLRSHRKPLERFLFALTVRSEIAR